MKQKESLRKFCRALRQQDNFLLTSHISPEGDAIGSTLATYSLLRRLGKKVLMVLDHTFPERFEWLHPSSYCRIEDISNKNVKLCRSLVALDCPVLKRIGRVQSLVTSKTVIFNIDHHVSNSYYGQFNYVLPKAAATGEAIINLFRFFRMPLTKKEATYLYVALATDTGSFRNANTTAQTHCLVAELMRTGIRVDKINERIYHNHSIRKMNLLGRLLSRVRMEGDGSIAWSWLAAKDFKDLQATDEDTDGFIDFVKFLKGVQVVFLAIERPGRQTVKVSLRSKGSHNVGSLASGLGGGGHKNAAACILSGNLVGIPEMILNRLKRELILS